MKYKLSLCVDNRVLFTENDKKFKHMCPHTHLLELVNKLSMALEYKRNTQKSIEFIT